MLWNEKPLFPKASSLTMSLLRASANIGSFTLLSRILGFVRDQLIAKFLGAGCDVGCVLCRV